MLTLEALQKSYGNNMVLSTINATFSAGKVYGVVGPNGAGKTTLFRCLAGLENYEGTISRAPTAIREYIGYVPAEPYFLPKITGVEYLRLMLEARKMAIEQLHSYNVFDLPLQEYISSYSTGMKKKLAILGALLQDNQVYILDEVYNGLDFQSSLMLTDIIGRLRQKGKLVIIASHIFSLLEETCDSIIYLKGGQFTLTALPDNFSTMKAHLAEDLADNSLDALFQQIGTR